MAIFRNVNFKSKSKFANCQNEKNIGRKWSENRVYCSKCTDIQMNLLHLSNIGRNRTHKKVRYAPGAMYSTMI